MGLQKLRADIMGATEHNGSVPYYAKWLGGPSLALIRNCPVHTCIPDAPIEPRTVYISGEPDSYTTQPAACKYKGKTLHGFITSQQGGPSGFAGYVFHTTLNPQQE